METLTNDFHGTKHRTKYTAEQRDEIDARIYQSRYPSREPGYQARRRAKNALCGIAGCVCGNSWGIR